MHAAVRSLLFGFFAFNLACTKTPRWHSEQWQGEGIPPLPSSFSHVVSKNSFKNKTIVIKQQVFAKVPIENAFAKFVLPQKTGFGESQHQNAWLSYQSVDEKFLPSARTIALGLKTRTSTLTAAKRQASKLSCKNSKTAIMAALPSIKWVNASWQLVYKGHCENSVGVPIEFIIADQGRIIDTKPAGSAFTPDADATEVEASLYPAGPKTSALQNIKLMVSQKPNFLSNPYLDVVSDAKIRIPSLLEIPSVSPKDPTFELLQVYYYAHSALLWVTKKFSHQPQALKVRTHVGYPERTNAAFYYDNEIRLGSGDDEIYSKLAFDRTIVTHETMHSLVDSLTRLPFRGEGGSLNEGLCDSLTALYLDSPRMGENAYLRGPFQRNLENEFNYQVRTGHLYADSLIMSGTVWAIRQQLGAAHASALVEHLITYLVPSSDFEDARQLVLLWLNDLKPSLKKDQLAVLLKQRGWL